MPLHVRTVSYFYTRVEDKPGKAYNVLSRLVSEEINLLAFSAIPYGSGIVELTLFPNSVDDLLSAAREMGWKLSGPQHAFLIQGDDRLGAIADIHRQLLDAGVDIYASTGVTDGQGHFGYVIYIKEGHFDAAAQALASVVTVNA
jgi:hypothetical protein